jgi:two-component system, NtrC family, sensor kinase
MVECYPGQLNQVFMNILANAIDALETDQAKSRQITIRTAVIEAQWVTITIADNGIGMLPQVQERIFNPFFTTKPVGKGTGMGMSISYQIITEKHGGALTCHSNVGEGTEFMIQIPIHQSRSN